MPPAQSPKPAAGDAGRDSHRRHEKMVATFESSFPGKVRALLVGINVPTCAHNSDGLKKACEENNREAQSILEMIETTRRDLAKAVAEAEESGEYHAVITQIENARFDKATMSQKIVKVWSTAVELLDHKIAELRPVPGLAGANEP